MYIDRVLFKVSYEFCEDIILRSFIENSALFPSIAIESIAIEMDQRQLRHLLLRKAKTEVTNVGQIVGHNAAFIWCLYRCRVISQHFHNHSNHFDFVFLWNIILLLLLFIIFDFIAFVYTLLC